MQLHLKVSNLDKSKLKDLIFYNRSKLLSSSIMDNSLSFVHVYHLEGDIDSMSELVYKLVLIDYSNYGSDLPNPSLNLFKLWLS